MRRRKGDPALASNVATVERQIESPTTAIAMTAGDPLEPLVVGTHKYEPLTEFLRHQPAVVVRMSFDEIERVLGAKLPPSATHHRAWWSNNAQNNVMTKAWKDAGFESEEVDMKARRVAFRRVRSEATRDNNAPTVDVTTKDRHPLIGWMKGTLTIAEGVDLTQPADPEWGEAAYGDRTLADRK